jgi:hypothetical protein
MRVYEAAKELKLSTPDLLEGFQKVGITKSSTLSSVSLEELEQVKQMFQSLKKKPSVKAKKKTSAVKKSKTTVLKKKVSAYEVQSPLPEVPQVKTVSQSQAKRIYRILCTAVLLILIGFGDVVVQDHLQMSRLVHQVNQTTQVLQDNQKTLNHSEQQLAKRVSQLEQKKVSVSPNNNLGEVQP